MEDRIKAAFDKMHMPERCETAIYDHMEIKKRSAAAGSGRMLRLAASMAAVFVLVMLIVVSNADIVNAIAANFTKPTNLEGSFYYYDLKKEECYFSIKSELDLVRTEDSRIYFTANGENIDITDKISEEDAFVYTFTDHNGILNIFAIGVSGLRSYDNPPYIGYLYYILYPDFNGDGLYNDGGGGCGRGQWDNEKDDYFGWYKIAIQTEKEFRFSQRPVE